MLAGFARRAINPEYPTDLAGFDLRKADSTGVLDDIFAAALALVSDAGQRWLLLSFDLLGVTRALCERLKKLLSKRLSIEEDCIWAVATHTHAAPRAAMMRRESDEAYVSRLLSGALDAAGEALHNLSHVTASFGKSAACGIASYRDVPRERSAYAMPLLKLIFENPTSRLGLVRMQCHPTVLNESNLLVSKDLAGVWEEDGADSDLLLANGACGDLSTRYTRQGAGPMELKRMRELLLNAIQNTPVQPLPGFGRRIRSASTLVRVESSQPLSLQEKRALIQTHEERLAEIKDEAAKRELISIIAVLKRDPKPREDSRDVALAAVNFESMMLFAMPFEIDSAEGAAMEAELSRRAGKSAFILCYAGGYEGYLPSGKPIGPDSNYQDVAASLAPGAKQAVMNAAIQLINTISEENSHE
ncbi:MAG: hypothetical protein IJU28_07530 [Clostridia bacterium]|nr:hypothetical protein [Clostridia bacterium]